MSFIVEELVAGISDPRALASLTIRLLFVIVLGAPSWVFNASTAADRVWQPSSYFSAHHSELFSDRKGEKLEKPFEDTARIPLFVGYFFRII